MQTVGSWVKLYVCSNNIGVAGFFFVCLWPVCKEVAHQYCGAEPRIDSRATLFGFGLAAPVQETKGVPQVIMLSWTRASVSLQQLMLVVPCPGLIVSLMQCRQPIERG